MDKKLIILTIGLILAIEGVDATALNIAFPTIATSFHVSPLNLKIALTSYLLAEGLCIPLSGWIAERYNLNSILIGSVIIFGVTSIMCALSTNLVELVVFRLIQGGSAAFAIPIGRLLVAKLFSETKSSQIAAIGSVMAISLVGNTIGPVIGGIITDISSWRWIFISNLPIVALCIYMIQAHIPSVIDKKIKPFDYLGYAIVCSSIMMFFLFFDQTVYATIQNIQPIVFFLGGLFFLFLYLFYASSKKDALFPLAMFANKEFLTALFSNFTFRLIFGSVPFVLSLLLQIAYQFSAYKAGLFIAVITLGMIVMKKFTGLFVEKIRYKELLISNSIAIGLITMLMAYLLSSHNLYYIISILFLYGLAISLQYSIMNVLGYANTTKSFLSQANAILNMSRLLGTNFGIAITAILISRLGGNDNGLIITDKSCTYVVLLMSIIAFINAGMFLFLKNEPLVETN